ncbi:hypothetical protein R6Q59_018370 [Mikania micrantha]
MVKLPMIRTLFFTSSRISSSSSAVQSVIPPDADGVASIPSDQDSIFRQFLHRRPPYLSSSTTLPEIVHPAVRNCYRGSGRWMLQKTETVFT